MKFWIYLEIELSDLQSKFEEIFSVDKLYRDYENVWEWLESSDRNSNYYINISRPHDWEKGEYDKPIVITVESNNGIELEEEKIAKLIKEQLTCDVFAGEITTGSTDEPIIGEYRTY